MLTVALDLHKNQNNNYNNNNNNQNNNKSNSNQNSNERTALVFGIAKNSQITEIKIPSSVRDIGQIIQHPSITSQLTEKNSRRSIILRSGELSFLLIYTYPQNSYTNLSKIQFFWEHNGREMFPLYGNIALIKVDTTFNNNKDFRFIDYSINQFNDDLNQQNLFENLKVEAKEMINFYYDKLKAKFPRPDIYLFVSDQNSIREAKNLLNDVDLIAMDTEGSNVVKLIQMAFDKDGKRVVLLLDPSSENSNEIFTLIRPILISETIKKVFHDVKQDAILLQKKSIPLANVFDTSAAYKFINRTKSDINLNKLLEEYNVPINCLKEFIKPHFSPTFWDERPLRNIKVDYAIMDVTLLLDLYHQIYNDLDHSSDFQFNKIIRESTQKLPQRMANGRGNMSAKTTNQQLEDLNQSMKREVSLDSFKFDNKEVEKLLNLQPPIFPKLVIEKIRDQLKGQDRVISEITFSKGRPCFLRFADKSGFCDDCIIELQSSRSVPVVEEDDEENGSNNIIDLSNGSADVNIEFDKDEAEDDFENNNNNNNNKDNNNDHLEDEDIDIVDELISLLLVRKSKNRYRKNGEDDFIDLNIDQDEGEGEGEGEGIVRRRSSKQKVKSEKAKRRDEVKDLFRRQHRTGISSTFHRISAIFNDNFVTGLTYRIGRMTISKVNLYEKLIVDPTKASRKSILVIGPPGSGKTTLLRSLIRELSDIYYRHVIVIDKTAEICGPSKIVPIILGERTRKIVPQLQNNYAICDSLIEAVSNHNPDYVAIDELANKNEVNAIAAIAERGISVIATVHGKGIDSLVKNGEMNRLLGGSQAVILSASEAEDRRLRGVKENDRKTAVSRMFEPLFDVVVELGVDGHCFVIDDPQSYYDRYLELQ